MPPPPQKPFFCTLCQKGYSRIHEFEAHENSYDHQHKKRFQEMKAMQRGSQAAPKAEGTGGLVKISLGEKKAGGGGFKKAGFKSAFGGGGEVKVVGVEKMEDAEEEEVVESEDDEAWGGYDPARPTA